MRGILGPASSGGGEAAVPERRDGAARRTGGRLTAAPALLAALLAHALLSAGPMGALELTVGAGALRTVSSGWGSVPLLQSDGVPVERRLRASVRNGIREVRRFLKRAVYLVTNSPTWWFRRVKRLFWPLIFASAALFFDTALLAAWKNDGARVLATYVPMMLYVYARLFVSKGASVITRVGVLMALVYGVWKRDLIPDGRWLTIGFGRVDDLVLIALAVRAFVATCPQELVELYAERAIAIRNRISGRTASLPG